MNFSQLVSPPSNLEVIVDPETGVRKPFFFAWMQGVYTALAVTIGKGFTGNVTLAALTGGGTQGTLTYTNGVVTAVVPPT